MPQFSHLHCHTQFSLLDGAANISKMMAKAQQDNMPAVAITDHGNMFGVFKFVAEAAKYNIKPIVGCEFYLVEDRHKRQFTREEKDVRYHQLLLAKNANGYKNLTKLCSLGYMEGLYGKYPRIDKELIVKYHKDLIATTCCIGAEVPKTILKKGEAEAEKVFKWWLDLFGDDYYVELQRHEMKEQQIVNEVLLKFAKKYNVKVIASNDSHYVDREDYNAHDILLCINTGEKQSTPSAKEFDDEAGIPKGNRFAFYNDEFYFKNTQEMSTLFSEIPEAIDNTNEIVDKVEHLKLKQDILLPNFPIPQEFQKHEDANLNQWEYLHHITFEGARERYKEITADIEERLNFELFTIRTMGFAGYFLIVADFIKQGRDIGVFVGPGRGSAAGSAVAYCIGITNIDPIKYNLLFERFLNPDRKSMPDIDTDFDDEGRQRVIDYVVDKYGKNQVAQIVTYGTMAAKMSIKDVARVLDLPLAESNALAKLVPDKPGIELGRVMKAPIDGPGSLKEKEGLDADSLVGVKELRRIAQGNDLQARVLKEAQILEGSVRGTGIHAAGIIIAPKDLSEIVPVATSKETDLLITQYDGKVIEDAGVIKMDFLGLKTLTIIRDALRLIKQNHGVEFDIDSIPLDDEKTLELYQKGETNGTFQFESVGMQKYLKELKPDKFEDLIAMNALYRPGPLEYIPNFIKRKHGLEEVSYDLADMEEYLADTYGITVYQEQVMLLSQKLADFTKGDADVLRKAMGKKDRKTLDKLKPQFIENAQKKGHDPKKLEKIWTDWEAFASYAFNKSHSTCYAFVAFQTAYLKAHYPSEYMASVLTHNLNNIDKVTFFMEECRRMGIKVLGPDLNESSYHFSVNKNGEIRFGLGAVKGVGEGAVEAIVEERSARGPFKTPFDMAQRINLRAASRKTFEALVQAGAFDCFTEIHRATYFYKEEDKDSTFLEKILKYGANMQSEESSAQHSLFGGGGASTEMPSPKIPKCEPYSEIEKLKIEKEVVGFYISGHPLDQFRLEIENFCTCTLDRWEEFKGKEVQVAGIVSSVNVRQGKNGKPFAIFAIEDYNSATEMVLFGEDYLKMSYMLVPGQFVYVKGKVEERYNAPGMWQIKPLSMQLLAEVREKLSKMVSMNITVGDLTESVIHKLENIALTHKGNCTWKLTVHLPEENMSVEMLSRKYKIDPSNEFLEAIKEIPEVRYRILQ
ncbi:DNA polymerase III subunit alpha [Cytophagales bacterium LB-30]|uniref:DNA polymerase III subunit alpha n=1 Tax=Shiella aurantiaca TaxID=3058365 RepID=A0ABT8F8D3_9BACT|nr:DNA polymerase III subunit alpha [Shiella aurantiaca]MDN4166548.1 DNA polymerase III subunit alpha [Shiella aurantiaca]